MSFLELIFPAINEIWIPLVLIIVGLIMALIGGLIPFLGGKISSIGWILVLGGILFWIIKVKFTELMNLITPNLMLIGGGILFLIIVSIIVFKKPRGK